MEVVVTTGAISRAELQSNRHHQQTNAQLFTGHAPFLLPNQQCRSIEGEKRRYIIRNWMYQLLLVFLKHNLNRC